MRKLLASVAVVAAGLTALTLVAPGAVASTASKAKPKPPVKLSGSVNDNGTAVANGGTIEIDQHDYFFGPTFVQIPGLTSRV